MNIFSSYKVKIKHYNKIFENRQDIKYIQNHCRFKKEYVPTLKNRGNFRKRPSVQSIKQGEESAAERGSENPCALEACK